MRLLVCGSRTWIDRDVIRREIGRIAPSEVIHGAAPGADTIAAGEAVVWAIAEERGIIVTPYPADWHHDGKAAGPIRNARMLAEGKPDRSLAFGALWKRVEAMGGSMTRVTGTGDMVRRMLAAGVPVRWVASPDVAAVDLTAMPDPPRTQT